MPFLRFNHVFVGLMLLASASAFFVAPRYPAVPDRLRGGAQSVLAPVSVPASSLGRWLDRKFSDGKVADEAGVGGKARTLGEVLAENETLRVKLANLTAELRGIKEHEAAWQSLGDVRALCTSVVVSGADAGNRDSLAVSSAAVPLNQGMPVLYPGGVVGRVERSGAGGAHVRLVTDYGFKLVAGFGRFRQGERGVEFVRLGLKSALVEGVGRGTMVIRSLTLKDVREAGLGENDWVIIDDPDWTKYLQGYRVGRIIAPVAPRKDAPLFAEIVIRPSDNLLSLREVMVMTRN